MFFRTRSLVFGLFLLFPTFAGAQEGPAFAERQPGSSLPCSSITSTPALRLEGPRIDMAGTLFVSPGARFTVTAEDGSKPTAKPVLDGREVADWPESWSPGEHSVGAVIVDGCDQGRTLAPIAFVVDAAPPALEVKAGTLEAVTERMVEPRRESRRVKRARKSGKPAAFDLLWSSGWEDRWERLGEQPVEIRSDRPQLFFRAPQGMSFEGEDRSGGAALFVTAGDSESSLDLVRFRTRSTPEGTMLEVEAADLVGNVARREWRVVNQLHAERGKR